MLSVKQLLYWTKLHKPEILRRARRVSIKFGTAKEVEIDGATYREVEARAVGDTIPRTVTMRFRGSGSGSKVWVSCSCEYFLFHSEVAVTRRGSSDIIHSNGRPPRVTNPRGVAHICKHIAICFIRGAYDLKPKRVREKRKPLTQRKRKN